MPRAESRWAAAPTVIGVDLDQIFCGVPRVGSIEGCLYCYSRADLDALGGDPAFVPDDLVRSFATSVFDHWPEDEYRLVWRGLAPRILRQVEEWPDVYLLRGLSYARLDTWPAIEQTAIHEALRAAVARAVVGLRDASPTAVCHVATLVCAASHADDDLTPWLHYLDTLTGADSDTGLARLAHHWAGDLALGGEPDLLWYPEDPIAPLRSWLLSDPLRERLVRIDDQETLRAIAMI